VIGRRYYLEVTGSGFVVRGFSRGTFRAEARTTRLTCFRDAATSGE
jgi:hypothetical protein